MTVSPISHSFTVTDGAFRAVPVPISISNEFDYFGSLLGLKRLPEEKNTSYKERLFDVYVHKANSTYTGLVNGITRELDLEFFNPITVTLNTGLDPSWSPKIEFSESIVYVWKDINTKLLDIEIIRGDPTTPEYFIGGLVDTINTSTVFTATADSLYLETRSDCILNSSSTQTIINQPLQASQYNYLGNENIERHSVVFSNKKVFRLEVDTEEEADVSGTYFIDYETGYIKNFDIPSDASFIQYSFTQSPFQPKASPVIVRAVNSPDFQRLIFNQVILQDGSLTNGTPNKLGAEIVNEIMSVIPTYWGT